MTPATFTLLLAVVALLLVVRHLQRQRDTLAARCGKLEAHWRQADIEAEYWRFRALRVAS